MRFATLTACSALALAAGASAQTMTPLIIQGDVVLNAGGAIFRIDALAVNNSGTWLVEADTSSTDVDADVVVLKNDLNMIFGQENRALTLPAGANISSFDSVGLNNNGDTGWNLFLRNLTTSTDSGIFFNYDLVLQESTVSMSPVFGVPTPYIGFFEVKMNDSNQLMAMSSVDDPNLATTVDRAIVIFDYDATMGTFTENVLFKEGDVLPGQTEAVTDFGTNTHAMAFNNAGTVMFVADLTGDTTLDGAIYIGSTLVAQEGQPSIVTGRNWRVLGTSTRLDVNNSGEGAWIGTLDGDTATDLIVATTTRKVIGEGESLPAIGGVFTFTGFGSAPVAIDDNGNVLWYGDWNDPDTTRDTGFFLNDQLLVQEGVTSVLVGGTPTLIQAISGVEGAFAMSDNGRFIIFECTLAIGAGVNAAILIDLGDTGCLADFNADGNVDPDDLGDYINCYFGVPPCDQADFNNDGNVDPDDLGDFINTYFAGC
ncbi:MAG: hypothetical protein AB7K52_07460 [Phycisphaerales bacterium]